MPTFRSARRVAHGPDEMFDLVADIDSYPQFVPLCLSTRTQRRTHDLSGREVVYSEMTVGYHSIREKFSTRVTLDRPRHKILVEYVDGPFSHLENIWTFHPEAEAGRSRVDFFIDYEFRNRVLGALMGKVFDSAFRKFAEAFEERADKIYGNKRV